MNRFIVLAMTTIALNSCRPSVREESQLNGVKDGNNGDVAYCERDPSNQLEGYYAFDYLQALRMGEKFIEPKTVEDALATVHRRLEEVHPDLAENFSEEFIPSLLKDSPTSTYTWKRVVNGFTNKPIVLDGDEFPNCKQRKTIIRRYEHVGISKKRMIEFEYDPLLEELKNQRPLQYSVIVSHEWFWDLINYRDETLPIEFPQIALRNVINVNALFHRSEETYLNGLGLVENLHKYGFYKPAFQSEIAQRTDWPINLGNEQRSSNRSKVFAVKDGETISVTIIVRNVDQFTATTFFGLLAHNYFNDERNWLVSLDRWRGLRAENELDKTKITPIGGQDGEVILKTRLKFEKGGYYAFEVRHGGFPYTLRMSPLADAPRKTR